MVRELKNDEQIEDVVFQKNWLETITKNIQKMQIVYIILALLFIIISIVLIQSAVRLGIFANRHTIKSMQFVGATNSFIIRPIIFTFVKYAFIAIPISFGLLWFIIWQLPDFMGNSEFSTMMFEFRNHINLQNLFIVSVSIAIFATPSEKEGMIFSKENYTLTIISVLVIVVGFALMAGKGGNIYDFRRTTLAPIGVIAGFVMGIYAIFYKKK